MSIGFAEIGWDVTCDYESHSPPLVGKIDPTAKHVVIDVPDEDPPGVNAIEIARHAVGIYMHGHPLVDLATLGISETVTNAHYPNKDLKNPKACQITFDRDDSDRVQVRVTNAAGPSQWGEIQDSLDAAASGGDLGREDHRGLSLIASLLDTKLHCGVLIEANTVAFFATIGFCVSSQLELDI